MEPQPQKRSLLLNTLNNQIERVKAIVGTRKELPCVEPPTNQEAEEQNKTTSANKTEKNEKSSTFEKPIISRLQNIITSITSKFTWTSSHEESVV
jgi:hypothetical protein